MENQVYRLDASDSKKIEFYVCSTNELEPYREIKDLGVVVIGKDLQIDASLNDDELDSLIDFLKECQKYIREFNDR